MALPALRSAAVVAFVLSWPVAGGFQLQGSTYSPPARSAASSAAPRQWTINVPSTSVLENGPSLVAPSRSAKTSSMRMTASSSSDDAPPPPRGGLIGFFSTLTRNFSEAAEEGFGTKARNVASTMKAGDVVVPLCSDLERRQELANRGIYVGVEYVICSMDEGEEGDSVHAALIRPAYPLRTHLERPDWPVSVAPLTDVPLWLNRNVYEAGTALGTAALALTTIASASFLAFFVRFAYVPSESMLPAVAPGDVVFVSRTLPGKGPFSPHAGDVVFFDPPAELDEAIASSKIGQAGGAVPTKGKQFLKRVVAEPGEEVGVRDSSPYVTIANKEWRDDDAAEGGGDRRPLQRVRADVTGPYSRPDVFPPSSWDRPSTKLGSHEYFVAGDNGPRSVDSRVWGPLKDRYVFGTAHMIVWPPEHFGPIRPGNFVEVVTDDVASSSD